ncbi:MAG: DNA topoisomerase III [Chlamydiales bacterium]|nr:DNA topoisomerase 3 [Chlamydiales bacterium]NCF71462.1 DNA topoisomerase III [Chlamydiales bacterium]
MKVVIAEKPSVAKDIARVLKVNHRKDGYFASQSYCITWAFGHIVGLCDPDAYDPKYKRWILDDLPLIPKQFITKVLRHSSSYKQFKTIERLCKLSDCEEIICATDAGREGELIFRLIYEKTKVNKPIKRLWISSQTDQAIAEGFSQLKEGSAYQSLYESARSRSEADWLVGINATRAYSIKYSQGQGVMSVGRVQTPVLNMIVKRYKENQNFTPETYYEIQAELLHEKGSFKGIYLDEKKNTRFFEKDKAEQIVQQVAQNSQGTIAKLEKKKKNEKPPLLYDLTSLQKEAHRLYKFSAEHTLNTLQSLYEKHKVLTYPRTSSRYLSSDLKGKVPQRLKQLQSIAFLTPFIEKLLSAPIKFSKRIVDDKKVTDHHAIIPTEKPCHLNSLSSDEKRLYIMVIKRFVAVFLEDCEKEQTEILSAFSNHHFKSSGTIIKVAGWRAVYLDDQQQDEQLLPAVVEKDPVEASKVNLLEKQTKPPPLYNEASILSAMETAGKEIDDEEMRQAMKDCGLGTPATRAQILERLIQVKYIVRAKNTLKPTEKGIYLIDSLLSPELLSADLTGGWEKKLNDIVACSYSRDTFMQEIKSFTKEVIEKVQQGKSPPPTFRVSSDKNLGNCPACEKGTVIKGKYNYFCTRYKEKCPFKIQLKLASKAISEATVKELLKNKRTKLIKGFKTQKGNPFDACLELNSQGQLKWDFHTLKASPSSSANSEKEGLFCPNCKSSLDKKANAFACSSCSFVLAKTIAGKKLTIKQCEKLLQKGSTGVIKGFKSKSGKKFQAELLLNEEQKILFKLHPEVSKG